MSVAQSKVQRFRNREQAQNFQFSETLINLQSSFRVVFDGVDTTDSLAQFRLVSRDFRESTRLFDFAITSVPSQGAISRAQRFRNREQVQSVSVADNVISLRERIRNTTDSCILIDALRTPGLAEITLTDSFNVADSTASIHARVRSNLNLITVNDSDQGIRTASRGIVDSLLVTENSQSLRDRFRGLDGSTTVLNDSVQSIRTLNRLSIDPVSVSEAVEILRLLNRTSIQNVTVDEFLYQIWDRERYLTDSLNVIDDAIATAFRRLYDQVLFDSLGVNDSKIAIHHIIIAQFNAMYGIEEGRSIDHGMEPRFHILSGISEETS